MTARGGRGARQLLVWFHAVTSIGWMTLALCLCTLLVTGHPDAAEVLDVKLLQHLATSAAFSGLMLAALTQWGYFRYWWVLVKFSITLVQLYLGIFILSPRLSHVDSGNIGPLVAASAFMASAIAFQAWLSVAKPWRTTPWTGRRPNQFPAWMFYAAVAVPIWDFVVWRAPIVSLLVALGFPIFRWRRREERTTNEAIQPPK